MVFLTLRGFLILFLMAAGWSERTRWDGCWLFEYQHFYYCLQYWLIFVFYVDVQEGSLILEQNFSRSRETKRGGICELVPSFTWKNPERISKAFLWNPGMFNLCFRISICYEFPQTKISICCKKVWCLKS